MYQRYAEMRDAKGMTDYRVAAETGLSRSTFTQWKHGISTPKAKNMKKIADCLGVSVESLLFE